MNIITAIFNNNKDLETIRKKIEYDYNVILKRVVVKSMQNNIDPHLVTMLHMLKIRYKVYDKIKQDEGLLAAEVAPFIISKNHKNNMKAFIDYIIYKEGLGNIDELFLEEHLNKAILEPYDNIEWKKWIELGIDLSLPWKKFISVNTELALKDEIKKHRY